MTSPTDNSQQGWQPIETAPKDGARVRVAHIFDPQSLKVETIFPIFGTFNGVSWDCNAAFTCTDGMLRWQPTHWLAAPGEGE